MEAKKLINTIIKNARFERYKKDTRYMWDHPLDGEIIDFSSPIMVSAPVCWTPKAALRALKFRQEQYQRDYSTYAAIETSAIILSGRFSNHNPHGPIFSKEGYMIDAQGRFGGIVISGKTVVMWTTFGVPLTEIFRIDCQIRPRSLADCLKYEGETDCPYKTSVLKNIQAIILDGADNSFKQRHYENMIILPIFRAQMTRVGTYRNVDKFMKHRALFACLAFLEYINPTIMASFTAKLMTGIGMSQKKSDPIRNIRNWLQTYQYMVGNGGTGGTGLALKLIHGVMFAAMQYDLKKPLTMEKTKIVTRAGTYWARVFDNSGLVYWKSKLNRKMMQRLLKICEPLRKASKTSTRRDAGEGKQNTRAEAIKEIHQAIGFIK